MGQTRSSAKQSGEKSSEANLVRQNPEQACKKTHSHHVLILLLLLLPKVAPALLLKSLICPPRKRKGGKRKECSNSERFEKGSDQGGARGSNSNQEVTEEQAARLSDAKGMDAGLLDAS